MLLHVFHLAMKAGRQPPQQMLFVSGDLDTRDPHAAEAQRTAAFDQRLRDCAGVENFVLSHGRATAVSIISKWHCRSLCIPPRKFALSTHMQSTCRAFPATR